jgi:uncharacterized membrane protein YphA (DoxX/SURF4 family)
MTIMSNLSRGAKAVRGLFAMSSLLVVVQYCVGSILLWSGIMKMRHPFDFLATVYQYELVSPGGGRIIAIVVPWLEAITGICLISYLFSYGALVCSTLLFAIFSIAQTSVIIRGLKISCGCFGPMVSGQVNYNSMTRVGVLLILSLICIWYERPGRVIKQGML